MGQRNVGTWCYNVVTPIVYSYVCCFSNPFDNIHDISSINLPAYGPNALIHGIKNNLIKKCFVSPVAVIPSFGGPSRGFFGGSPFQGPEVGPIFQQRWIPPPPPAAPRLPSGFVHGCVAPPIPSSSSAPVVTGGPWCRGPWENDDEALAGDFLGFSSLF